MLTDAQIDAALRAASPLPWEWQRVDGQLYIRCMAGAQPWIAVDDDEAAIAAAMGV